MRIRTLRQASAAALALSLPLVILSVGAAQPTGGPPAATSLTAAGKPHACPDARSLAKPDSAAACTPNTQAAEAAAAPSPAPSSWQERLAVVAAAIGAVVFLTMRQVASQRHGSPGGVSARRPAPQAWGGAAAPAPNADGPWRGDTAPGYLLSSFDPIDATTEPAVFDPLPSLRPQPATEAALSHAQARHPA